MRIEEIVGIVAGVITTIAVLPQIAKAVKNRKVNDINPFMFIILCIGVGMWTVYGILKSDWPIIVTNGISFIFNSIMLIILITQKKELH